MSEYPSSQDEWPRGPTEPTPSLPQKDPWPEHQPNREPEQRNETPDSMIDPDRPWDRGGDETGR